MLKMNMGVLPLSMAVALTPVLCAAAIKGEQPTQPPPNFVVIFLDDAGYSDFHVFDTPPYPTPHVEKLAMEGTRFPRFYVPQAVCSASRASLLTGCYPGRTKIFGALGPRGSGLSEEFATIGEVLKPRGYATASFGKWHVGDTEETRPPARGFDESSGLMYSNDMWKHHPGTRHFDQWPLQFWKNGKITIEDVSPEDQRHLTRWATEHSVDFINRHAGQPFFLYVPHIMPHVPLFCSEAFEGKSGAGLYGDVIMEIDWSVGQIMEALEANGLADNTLVLFTSDNGPWTLYGDHGGVTPFRGAKTTSFEGGTRSGCIVRFPGMTPAGKISTTTWSTLDNLPTFAALAGADLPENPIDGKDLRPVLSGDPHFKNPHAYYAFSIGRELQSILSGDGRWKLHQPYEYRIVEEAGGNGLPGKFARERIEYALYNLDKDPMESINVIEQYPEVAERMKALIARHAGMFYDTSEDPD